MFVINYIRILHMNFIHGNVGMMAFYLATFS